MNIFRRLLNKGGTQRTASFSIHESDIFIVSYPKSGNTWVRFLIGNYLTDGRMDFKDSHQVIPDMHFNPRDIDKIKLKPRFIKSHDSFNENFRNVIYIVRDGRDVAISYFFFLKKTGDLPVDISFDEFFNSRFITGNVGFGDWGEHVKSWLNARSVNKIMVKYEDLMDETEKVFTRILYYLKLKDIDADRVRMSIAQSSFESMSKNESNNPEYFYELGGLKDTGYGFMRKGEVGDWRNHFTEDNLVRFKAKYGELMRELGYEF